MYIDNLIKEATLEKNSAKKEAYRAIKAELLLIQTGSGGQKPRPVTDLDIIKIAKKQIEIKEEQINMYDANSRKDLADMYREQLKYFKELLPPEISRDKIQEAVMNAYPNGYTQKEMGKVIKEIKEIYPTADGKVISEIVKEHIK
jgi:uncharacterized protein YqeY